ncbi:unnamed protein product, partial [Gadus morhua 'NCC']
MIQTKHREYYGQQNCRGGIYARPAPVICVSAHACGGHGCLATDTTHRRCSQKPRLLKMSTTPDTSPRPQKRKRLQKYGREWEDAHPRLDSVSGDVYKASCKICRRVFSVAHGGLSDIRQHATGEQHCRHERSQKTQASVSQFFYILLAVVWSGFARLQFFIPQSSPEVDTPKAATFCSSQCPLKQQLQQAVSQAKPSGYSASTGKVLLRQYWIRTANA